MGSQILLWGDINHKNSCEIFNPSYIRRNKLMLHIVWIPEIHSEEGTLTLFTIQLCLVAQKVLLFHPYLHPFLILQLAEDFKFLHVESCPSRICKQSTTQFSCCWRHFATKGVEKIVQEGWKEGEGWKVSSGELPKGKCSFRHWKGKVDVCIWSWEGLAGGRTSREGDGCRQ